MKKVSETKLIWLVPVILAIAILVQAIANSAANSQIELEVVDVDHMHQFVIMYVGLLDDISENDSLTVKIGNITFKATYYKSVRPEEEFEKSQMEFLDQPLQDRIGFWFRPEVADSLGLDNFEDIKGFISSKKVTLIVTK